MILDMYMPVREKETNILHIRDRDKEEKKKKKNGKQNKRIRFDYK
jgi:hypothetical protein